MSHDILFQLGAVTLAVSAAIVLVLLIRKRVGKVFGPHIAYAFWLIVPAVAIAGLLPADQVFQAVPALTQIVSPEAMPLAATPVLDELVSAVGSGVAAGGNLPSIVNVQIGSVLFTVWIVGALMAVGLLVYRQRKFLNNSALTRVGARLYRAGKNTVGPAAVGILKARIVVPSDFCERYSGLERKLIVDHEREHIRYGDVRTNAFAAVFQCLNWFNPLVYAAQKALREDQELACDARVMQKYIGQKGYKKAYAEALLKAQFVGQPIPVGCAWPNNGGKTLKHRIANLGQPRSSTLRNVGGVLACALAVAVTGQAVRAMMPAETIYITNDSDQTDITRQVKPFKEVTSDSGIPSLIVGSTQRIALKGATGATSLEQIVKPMEKVVTDLEDLPDALGAALVEALSDGRSNHARALIKAGADTDFYKRGDGTPLTMAVNRGDERAVRMLLKAGADANRLAPGDGSPLIVAVSRGGADILNLLLENGADANGYVPGDGTPLIVAIKEGDVRSIDVLLDAGADANRAAPGDGSPLIVASARGRLKFVTLLVNKGADVNGYIPGDETPLIAAAAENEIDVARFLIEQGADVNLAVQANDRRGRSITRSPLGQAERFGNDRMVKLLKDNGAKPVPKEQ